MKALLYTDLVAVGKSVKTFLFSIAMICGIVTFTSLYHEGVTAEEAAEIIQANILSIGTLMFAFFAFFQLFGQDEREGWESVKLSLPVSRRDVVVGRYLVMLLIIVVLLAAGAIVGAIIAAIATQVKFGSVTLMPVSEIALGAVIALSCSLVYLAIETPLFFKMGFTKARLFFTMPFFACLLFTLEPVQRWLGSLPSPEELFGNPLPLVAGLAVVAGMLYAISARISTRVYTKREF